MLSSMCPCMIHCIPSYTYVLWCLAFPISPYEVKLCTYTVVLRILHWLIATDVVVDTFTYMQVHIPTQSRGNLKKT